MGIQRGAVARSQHTTSRAIGDEFIVVDRRRSTAHALSGEHAQVWRELGGDHRQVVALTDAERADAVAELQALGLLSTGVGRRAVLRRAGVVGGVTMGAGIASIALPDAASAKSQPVVTQTTTGAFSFTVPTGEDITRVEFTVIGAGGGGRSAAANGVCFGGAGAQVTGRATRSLSAGGLGGVVISGYVGEGGRSSGAGGAGSVSNARGGGGGGAATGTATFALGAGGGGATTLQLDGTPIVIAGAGGGAPSTYFPLNVSGGAAGSDGGSAFPNSGASGRGGLAGNGASGGAGGTHAGAAPGQSGTAGTDDANGGRGGTGGTGVPSGTGNVNIGGGGGGGGGGYGGGGGGEGGGGNGSGGGGAGGSSFLGSGVINGITLVVNNPTAPPAGGSGAGGPNALNGNDGSVSLTYRTFV